MRRLSLPARGVFFMTVLFLALVSVSAHKESEARHLESWFKKGPDRRLAAVRPFQAQLGHGQKDDDRDDDRSDDRNGHEDMKDIVAFMRLLD